MFGIGLPELILIMAVALIVVGPDKLPDLAKTLARQMVDLKRAANSLKDSLSEEELKPWEKDPHELTQIGGAEQEISVNGPGKVVVVGEPTEGGVNDETEGGAGSLVDKEDDVVMASKVSEEKENV